MSEADTKSRFGNGTTTKPKFGGGAAIRLGGGYRQGSKPKGPTSGLQDVMYGVFKAQGKMLTQWRTNEDRVSQYVGKNFGGAAGPMAAQAMRTREEPVGVKPETPVGESAIPGTPAMIIWQEEYKQYNKRERIWEEEVNPRLFNLLLDHMTAEFRALVEGRPSWPNICATQDGIGLIREMHTLHHLQDGARPGM